MIGRLKRIKMAKVIKHIDGKYSVGCVDLMTAPDKDKVNAPLGVFARVFYPICKGKESPVSGRAKLTISISVQSRKLWCTDEHRKGVQRANLWYQRFVLNHIYKHNVEVEASFGLPLGAPSS